MFVRTLDGSMLNVNYIVAMVKMSDFWDVYLDAAACGSVRRMARLSDEAVAAITSTDEPAPMPPHQAPRQ